MKGRRHELSLPRAARAEITHLADRLGRSTGFAVRRLLVAARGVASADLGVPPARDPAARQPLRLEVDEQDDPQTLPRIEALIAARQAADAALSPGDVVALSWAAVRPQFQAWLDRHDAIDRAAQADDIDGALAEAAAAATSPERLAALAESEYVRVRILVARHPATPIAALERLLAARDRGVQAALRERPALPAALRDRLG